VSVDTRVIAARAKADRGSKPARRRPVDATAYLTVVLVVLLLIPSQLVVSGVSTSPAGILGLVALVWWATSAFHPGGRLERGRQPIHIALAIYAVAVLVSYAASFTHFLYADEVRSADRAILFLGGFAGIALLSADGISSWSRLDTLIRRFTALGAVVGGLGVIQFFTGFDVAPLYNGIPGLRSNEALSLIGVRSDFRRVAGTAAHPIEFGVLMAMVLPFALHYAFQAADKRERRWRYAIVLIVACGVAMSLSRSGMIGAAVAFLVLAPTWHWRRLINVSVAAVLFVGAMRLSIPGIVGTLENLFTQFSSDTSTQAREQRYPAAFHLIHQHIWIGRGIGTLLPSHLVENGVAILDNQYLGAAIEIGVIGLTALIAMQVIGAFTARGARRRAHGDAPRSLCQSICASICVCIASFATFDAFSFIKVGFGLALMLGLAGAAWRLAPQTRGASRQRSSGQPLAVAASSASTTRS
jgi:hypothetical protein